MTNASEDTGLRRVRNALRSALKQAGAMKPVIAVQHSYRDNMHALAASDVFDGLSTKERHELIRPSLRRLPVDVSMRLTLLLLLTPDEYTDLRAEDRILIGS